MAEAGADGWYEGRFMNPNIAEVTVPVDLVEVGKVLDAHGIKGWIKIQPFSSGSNTLSSVKRWWLVAPTDPLSASGSSALPPLKPVAVSVAWARDHGNLFLASLKGVGDRDAAETLKGQRIFVARSDFPPPAADEYYWVDLIGCRVSTTESGSPVALGVVISILDSPAHPLLVVRQQRLGDDGQWHDRLDARGRPIEALIPFVAAHVTSVDLKTREIVTDWPEDF